jgi:hypothetical protein
VPRPLSPSATDAANDQCRNNTHNLEPLPITHTRTHHQVEEITGIEKPAYGIKSTKKQPDGSFEVLHRTTARTTTTNHRGSFEARRGALTYSPTRLLTCLFTPLPT